ncbi:hypothetical protein RIF29_22269 [Crotalaria pallida]|uniref:BHLH domain-containing protein n=1 Tax=Crotalaria pallida TaxID=3830 RepID=A0AAN9FD25_CROPI
MADHQKMLDSTQARVTRSSAGLPSIYYGNDHGQILVHGCANLRAASTTSTSHGYICTPLFTQHPLLPSSPLKKPRIDSNQIAPVTTSQKQDFGKVNYFSNNVLRPSQFLKSTHNNGGNSATLLHTKNTSVEQVKGQTALVSETSNKVSFVAKSEEQLPDEYSEATGHKTALQGSHEQCHKQNSCSAGDRAKGKADIEFCSEPLQPSSSVCSLEASNNTNICSMKNEETDESTYLSDNDEEPEDVVKEKPAWEGTRTGFKRGRDTKIHSLNERKRRDKINKKMRVLKELIPNCNKIDKASMLDDAIQYLKTLKLQLQILSMGRGLCMPLMMLPTAAHHQLMGAGMGFRPGTNIPCNLPQFPIPPLPGINGNRAHQMFGFPNQMPPLLMPRTPFFPITVLQETNLRNSTEFVGYDWLDIGAWN